MNVEGFIPMVEDLSGWNGDSPIFGELIEVIRPKVIIEIGSWKGQSTINMAKELKRHNLDAKIYAVDTWLGALEFEENNKIYGRDWDTMKKWGYPQVYYQFLSNVIHNEVLDYIEPIPNTSENAYPHLPSADMIYVDGNHTYKAVCEDLSNYYPKLNQGGVIFGDDYFLSVSKKGRIDGYECSVKEAVDEFASNNRVNLQTKYNNFWIIWKK